MFARPLSHGAELFYYHIGFRRLSSAEVSALALSSYRRTLACRAKTREYLRQSTRY